MRYAINIFKKIRIRFHREYDHVCVYLLLQTDFIYKIETSTVFYWYNAFFIEWWHAGVHSLQQNVGNKCTDLQSHSQVHFKIRDLVIENFSMDCSMLFSYPVILISRYQQ